LGREREIEVKQVSINPEKDTKGRTVLVIGSGPAGLAAAWQMHQRGFNVTIYEKDAIIGGCLTLIPDVRLDKIHLNNLSAKLLDAGISIKTEVNVNLKDLEQLRKKFDLVIVATGTHTPRKLGVEGEDMPNTTYALDFLCGRAGPPPSDAVIIGGGNVAIDCAFLATQFGASQVRVCYRKTEADMRATREEIEYAKKNGVQFLFEHVPTSILENGVVFKLGGGSETFLKCDQVIIAVGQTTDIPTGIETMDNIYVIGDAAIGPSSIVSAVTHAKEITYRIK